MRFLDLVHELDVQILERLLHTFDRVLAEGFFVQDMREEVFLEVVAALVAPMPVIDAEETTVLVTGLQDRLEPSVNLNGTVVVRSAGSIHGPRCSS